jgi:hypothetical protein
LSLNQTSQVAPMTPTCGPTSEDSVFTTTGGQIISGTRPRFGGGPGTVPGINFGSNGWFVSAGNSNYNSLQLNLRHTSGPLDFLAGYTYSKALDNASGYGEQINPINPKLSKSLSAFDVTHNFVISYIYRLPLDKLGGPARLTRGWQLSGITRFATGQPVTLIETDDRSLLGTPFTGPFPTPVDTPNFSPGPLNFTNPRSGQPFFSTSLFSQEQLGQLGTANRRFFHGPGVSNFDMSVQKDTNITERMRLEFRAEFFNIFNHAQFVFVQGNFNSTSFGQVTSAADPRIVQFGLKLLF